MRGRMQGQMTAPERAEERYKRECALFRTSIIMQHSKPISIPAHSRRPSSLSGSSDDEDDPSSPPLKTPTSPAPSPHVRTANPPASPSASTSPILSYFFASPPKAAAAPTNPTIPFGSLGRQYPFGPRSAAEPAPTVLEEDEDAVEPAIVRHARRLSSSGWPPSGPASRFTTGNVVVGSPAPLPTTEQQERGAGIFRRLSLGGALSRPQIPTTTKQPMAEVPQRVGSPPATSRSGTAVPSPQRKARRSTTAASGDGRPRRAPSPMGERILKGHFDGFN